MQKLFILFGLWLIMFGAKAQQPYIDILSLRYTNGIHQKSANGTPFTNIFIEANLPFKFKNGALLIFNPAYENWNIDSAGNKNFLPLISSISLTVGFIFPVNKKWGITVAAIPRYTSEGLSIDDNTFQIGGAVYASYQRKERLRYKFGVYANNQFFGVPVIPLAGIDWKINERNNLSGLLPGRLTYEYKLNNFFYTGASFRAFTNSYRLSNGNYLRLDDHQLSAYLDCYAAKHFVFTLEPGYSILRELRLGREHNKNYLNDYNWGDGIFIRLSASYRIRL